jgi:hypothetical protein
MLAACLIALPLSAQDVGIAECDHFLERYQACVDTLPSAEQRARLSGRIEEYRTEWRALAADPSRHPWLVARCTQFTGIMTRGLAPIGCSF